MEHTQNLPLLGGNIKHFKNKWEELTSCKENLETVNGLSIELSEYPHNLSSYQYPLNDQEEQFVSNEIQNLLSQRVITRCQHEIGEIISPIFTTPKNDGTHRLILNLKKLNSKVPYHHFKMETLDTILKLVSKGCFMAKLDIKQAYYSVPIKEEHTKLLKFRFNNDLFKFLVLPNGYSQGPRKFTKLMRVPMSFLRKLKIIIAAYIDDLFTKARSYNECLRNILSIVEVLTSLGFYINWEKSVLEPSNILEFLGFLINSIDMTVKLTPTKKQKIIQLANQVLNSTGPTIRTVAKLLGKFTSSMPAVMFGKLHYRALERDKISALKHKKGNFDKVMHISFEAGQDIHWWITNLDNSFNVIYHTNPAHTIKTDASSTIGWGACFGNFSTGGLFTQTEKESHINVLEIKGGFFGLKALCDNLSNTHIKILMDNTTAVQCVNNMGSCRSVEIDKIVHNVWEWAISKQNWITAAHIPGVLNVVADLESRKAEIRTEWKLAEVEFLRIKAAFPIVLDIDLFASRINAQLKLFVAYRPDPDAIYIDAFTICWKTLNFYAFPPFSIISRTLQKIIYDKATGVLVVPDWPNQAWYPVFQSLIIDANIIHIKPRKLLLNLPNQPQMIHPIWDRLPLLAGIVSGKH